MRFDDMLATVLARTPERPTAVAAQWRQLLDLVAQRRGDGARGLTDAALARLEASRDAVPIEARRDAVAAIAHQPLSPELFAVLADDVPVVTGALIARAPLGDAQWLALIPTLGPAGRALLRHRRDLGVQVTAALNAYGASDLLLTGSTVPEPIEDMSPIATPDGEAADEPAFEDAGEAQAGTPAVEEAADPGADEAAPNPLAEADRREEGADVDASPVGSSEPPEDEVVAPADETEASEPHALATPELQDVTVPEADATPVHDEPGHEEPVHAEPGHGDPEDAVFEEWFEDVELIAGPAPMPEPETEEDAPAAAVPAEGGHETVHDGPASASGTAEEAAPVEAHEPAPASREGRVVPLFGTMPDEEQRELPLAGGEAGAEPFSPVSGSGQIRSIISRIARFRSGEGLGSPRGGPTTQFVFETDAGGAIRYADIGPRGALIGETIARAAVGLHGVDGQAAGAFRKRAPFRDARLVIAGESEIGGEWRIAGVPVFAPSDGRFLGYRATARRPLADERAEEAPAHPPREDGARRGDTLRQIVHELRTPLNAIGGFAEMIRRQMRGPVAEPYRDRARDIADQAGRLMAAVDDLDVAARLAGERMDLQHLPVALAALLAPVCGEQAEAARARGLDFEAAMPLDLPVVLGDAAAIRRMVARLLAAATALAMPGEPVRFAGEQAGDYVLLRIARPARLDGVAEEQLFDPGWQAHGEAADAPLLGLGFSLHLIRRLAASSGGQLLVDDGWFTLRLPVAEPLNDAIPAES